VSSVLQAAMIDVIQLFSESDANAGTVTVVAIPHMV
jgi:hypothetical protein